MKPVAAPHNPRTGNAKTPNRDRLGVLMLWG